MLQQRQYFRVIGKYDKIISLDEIWKMPATIHFLDREDRLKTAKSCLVKNDAIMTTVVVDRQHEDGYELHSITKSGIVFIMNKEKYENGEPSLITILIARPTQLERYKPIYTASVYTRLLADDHEVSGLNL
ncbi:MAG: hypothetical protein IJU14_04320 [Clostridia bacterium]|nr:hypothetical protein [Clostridia bacterium]